MALDVFGSSSAAGLEPYVPSAAPDGDRFRQKDFIGVPLIISVHGPREVDGKFGRSTVIVADVIVVGKEPHKFEKAWLTGGAVVDGLMESTGRTIVAKVVYKKSKAGNDYFALDAPTADEVEAANKAFAALQLPLF